MIRMTLVSAPFRQFGSCFELFLVLQDKHTLRTVSDDIKFVCTSCEKEQESSPKTRFLPVSKARANKHIFRDYVACPSSIYGF